jgi:hypothetical protein
MFSRWTGVVIGATLFAANAGAALAATWSVETAPAPPDQGFSAYLHDVSCPTPSSCVAVGSYVDAPEGRTLPLVERRHGSSWSVENVPLPRGASLNGVSCTSPSACVAVGSWAGAPLVARWDGSSWSLEAVPLPPQGIESALNSVSCSSDTDCIAVGTYTGFGRTRPPGIFAEHWNGAGWTVRSIPSPTTDGDASLDDISCASATACTAVGRFDTNGWDTVLVERWNGIVWSQQPPQTPPRVYFSSSAFVGVSCPSVTACTAVGHTRVQYDGDALAERWNGATWSVQQTPTPDSTSAGLIEVSCASPSVCTAITGPGAQRWEAGGGWVVETIPMPQEAASHGNTEGVSCAKPTICVAVGGYWANGSFHPFVARYE